MGEHDRSVGRRDPQTFADEGAVGKTMERVEPMNQSEILVCKRQRIVRIREHYRQVLCPLVAGQPMPESLVAEVVVVIQIPKRSNFLCPLIGVNQTSIKLQ